MKIAIVGNADPNAMSYLPRTLAPLPELLSGSSLKIFTGACTGIPHRLGKEIIEQGGEVIGFSPATDLKEHTGEFGFPVDGCSSLRYLAKSAASKTEAYLIRSTEMICECNLVIALGGSHGTLHELTTGYIAGTDIICFELKSGISRNFPTVLSFCGPEHYGSSIQSFARLGELCNYLAGCYLTQSRPQLRNTKSGRTLA